MPSRFAILIGRSGNHPLLVSMTFVDLPGAGGYETSIRLGSAGHGKQGENGSRGLFLSQEEPACLAGRYLVGLQIGIRDRKGAIADQVGFLGARKMDPVLRKTNRIQSGLEGRFELSDTNATGNSFRPTRE